MEEGSTGDSLPHKPRFEDSAWQNPTYTKLGTPKVTLFRWDSNQEFFDEQDPPSIPSTPELIPRKFSLSAPVALGKTDRLVRSKSTTITKDHWKFYYSNNCQLKCKNEKWDCTHAPIKSRAIVTPSWFWSEDQLKQPDIKRWKRDYRSFMHSVYLPPCQITKKEKEEMQWRIKCRAWINTHQRWMK